MRKLTIKMRERNVGDVDFFYYDETTGEPIATLFRDTNMNGYVLYIHLPEFVDESFCIGNKLEGRSVLEKELIKKGCEVSNRYFTTP